MFSFVWGHFRTGDPVEYPISAGVLVCCIGLTAVIGIGGDFIPFFPDWAARYDLGLADAKEWKDNRSNKLKIKKRVTHTKYITN